MYELASVRFPLNEHVCVCGCHSSWTCSIHFKMLTIYTHIWQTRKISL